jgi:hypothetical protein
MSIGLALGPLFAQVLLVFILMLWMAKERQTAIRRGEVHFRDIALREPKWPPRALQVANSFSNQFEIPVLFYVVTILALQTKQIDFLFLILSWVFVALRYFHALIHTTSNRVPRRGLVYGLGVLIVMVLWIKVALQIYLL